MSTFYHTTSLLDRQKLILDCKGLFTPVRLNQGWTQPHTASGCTSTPWQPHINPASTLGFDRWERAEAVFKLTFWMDRRNVNIIPTLSHTQSSCTQVKPHPSQIIPRSSHTQVKSNINWIIFIIMNINIKDEFYKYTDLTLVRYGLFWSGNFPHASSFIYQFSSIL